jgi:hypothetical protein
MKRIWIIISALVLLSSCGEDVIEFTPTEKFNSIFDNPSEDIEFNPLDVIETDDGGFLVLSSIGNASIFILKVNNRGDFLWSKQLESQFVNPVPNLVRKGDNFYFVGGRQPDISSTLFEINDLKQTVEPVRTYDAYRKPLAFDNLTQDTYLLLTYNDTTGTVLSKIQDGFAMEWARKYDSIPNAFQKLESFQNVNNVNFIVGAYNAGSVIFFNSLREEGFNLTFANDQGIETGKISGSQSNFINSAVPNGNGLMSFNYNFNNQTYFMNNYQPNLNDSISLPNLDGELMQDRLGIQNALSEVVTIGTSNYLVNAYTTLDGRIKLNFYDVASGEQIAIKYVGGIDPLEIVKIIPTRDEGMLLLSKITLVGIKDRISLLKIPKEEILELW